MTPRTRAVAILLVAVAFLSVACGSDADPAAPNVVDVPVDPELSDTTASMTLVTNALIFTGDETDPWAASLAFGADGTVAAVGNEDDVVGVVGTSLRIVDGSANAVIPGHSHLDKIVEAVKAGCANLARHISNVKSFGVPVVVAINRFVADTDAEVKAVEGTAAGLGAKAILCTHWSDGGAGTEEPQGLGIERFFEAIALVPSTWMVFLVIAFAVHIAHHVVLVPKLGSTAGQKALGLGLVRLADGGRANVKDVGVRAAASVVGSLLFLGGALWGWLLQPLARGAGDLAASTVVVDRRDVP